MKIIKPSIEIMRHGMEINPMTPEQFIEKVGRTCYKSEDKITDTSAGRFVTGLVKRGHEAMIEHWSPIFRTSEYYFDMMLDDHETLMCCLDMRDGEKLDSQLKPFLRFTAQTTDDGDERYIVSGNMRAWRDYTKACVKIFGYVPQYLYGIIMTLPLFFPEFIDWVPSIIVNDILIPITASQLVGYDEHAIHHTVTMKFICDRGVSHEIVRHRTASFAQESTRYCNYSNDKYGREITIVEPAKLADGGISKIRDIWFDSCLKSEKAYIALLEEGCSPQEARAVLPNSLKTEVIMTANLDCWAHFLELRCAPDAHPDIQVVSKMAKDAINHVLELIG